MKRLGVLARRYGFDALIAIAAAAAALEVVLRDDASQALATPVWFAAPAVAFVVVLLEARHRLPFVAPLSLWLVASALSFVDGGLMVLPAAALFAGMAAAFLLGSVRDRFQARTGLAVVISSAAIIVYNNPAHVPGDLLFTPIQFVIAWVAGAALHRRAAQAAAAERRAEEAERERVAATRVAVAEERARIARELHDIVAHAVSVMVLQIGAVRHNLPPARDGDRQVLEGVEQTGRSALGQMRRLLGAMRSDGQDVDLTPQPGLDDLPALIDDVARAGLPVHVYCEGDRSPLPRAVDLSAYRVVQEGLTNALRHAQATRADISLRYRPDHLEIEIRDNGRGPGAGGDVGHGLVGVRERVKIYGGQMTSGPAPDGGFVLTARLPLSGHRP